MGGKQYLYSTKLPFSEVLKNNLDDLKARVFKFNKASLLCVDGGVGEGKTTLAVHCADYLNEKPIKFNEQLAMGGEDFQAKLRVCYSQKLPVLVYDEAGDFNRRGALTRFNSDLNRVFETYRAFKIVIILVLPSFYDLDSTLMKKEILRGLIHTYRRTNRQGNFKGYSLYRCYYLREKMNKITVKPQAFALTEPNFYGHFLDLPPDRQKALDEYTISGKIMLLDLNIAKGKGLITQEQICRELGRSRVWVSRHLGGAKVKPEQTIRRTKYYKPEVLDRLRLLKKNV